MAIFDVFFGCFAPHCGQVDALSLTGDPHSLQGLIATKNPHHFIINDRDHTIRFKITQTHIVLFIQHSTEIGQTILSYHNDVLHISIHNIGL